MSRILSAFLVVPALCAVLCAQDAPKVETVTFGKGGFAAGDKITASNTMKMKTVVDVSVDGTPMQHQEIGMTTTTLVKTLVRKVGADGPTVIDVTFDKAEMKADGDDEIASQMGAAEFPLTALVGKTYRVDVSGATPAISMADGEAASPSDVEALRSVVIGGGKLKGLGAEMTDLVPAGEMTVGHVIKFDGNAFKNLFDFGADDDGGLPMEMITGTLTLRGTRRVLGAECGVFEIVVTIDGKMAVPGLPDEATLSGAPKGEVLIGLKDRRIYRTDVKGGVVAHMSGAIEEMGGAVMEMNQNIDIEASSFSVYEKVELEADKAKVEKQG